MRGLESKTWDELTYVTKVAVDNNLRFNFIQEESNSLVSSSAIEIVMNMSPTQMWHAIFKKLESAGINIYEGNFEHLEEYVTEQKRLKDLK